MALPTYAEFFANIRGPIGPKGRPGTFDDATAEAVPSETVDLKPTISGDEGQFIHFKLPRGLPGTNAVANDTAFATYLSSPDTETRAAADAVYIVYRIYVPGVGYPDRIPGACNVFLGPVDPGLAMDPTMDFWENPTEYTPRGIVTRVPATVTTVSAKAHAGADEVLFADADRDDSVGGRLSTAGTFVRRYWPTVLQPAAPVRSST